MEIIAHRRNSIQELEATDSRFGVEVDLRSKGSQIFLQHDPFKSGDRFEEWLESYQHGCLILNVKEDGLEREVEKMLVDRGHSNYFFLDQTIPTIIKCSRDNVSKSAIRVSEFELVEAASRFVGRVEWVWLDSFEHFSFTSEDVTSLKHAGFKLCLVSPELQGRTSSEEFTIFLSEIISTRSYFDAVCTKRPFDWLSIIQR